jgi:hypothetical protein
LGMCFSLGNRERVMHLSIWVSMKSVDLYYLQLVAFIKGNTSFTNDCIPSEYFFFRQKIPFLSSSLILIRENISVKSSDFQTGSMADEQNIAYLLSAMIYSCRNMLL